MTVSQWTTTKAFAIGFTSVALACSGEPEQQSDEPGTAMSAAVIVSPADNQTFDGNVTVRLETNGVEIRPAGTNEPGTGHHHLFIDRDITAVGEPIPTGDGVVHLGGAQTEYVFENLAPGNHAIVAVLGDYLHVRLPDVATDTLHVTIAGT